jgi:hypothetical protein
VLRYRRSSYRQLLVSELYNPEDKKLRIQEYAGMGIRAELREFNSHDRNDLVVQYAYNIATSYYVFIHSWNQFVSIEI